jgi:hypothetical protein
MKKDTYRVNILMLLLFLCLSAKNGIAQPPLGAYGPPGYNQAPAPYSPAPGVEIIAPTAPPPLQSEVIIAAPSPAHVWLPGYWNWQNRWVWMPGRWEIPPRPGMRWEGHRWIMHEDGNRWRMHHGEWR